MPLMHSLARMEAMAAGRAQPLTTVLHRHLSRQPLVLVPLTTAGEVGAPLGAMLGTDRDHPLLLTVPQPKDRDLRFTFLSDLAEALLPHLESALEETEQVREDAEVCTDAPQLLVPNAPGAEFVRLLGRSMRFRRTAEEDPQTPYPSPARVPLLGRWLTHYGERARVPGSSLLLSMTEVLTRHWATGQSSLEDQHLGALLAWLRAGPEGGGDTAALEVETARDEHGQLRTPPSGPSTDPAFDNRVLAPAVDRYDADLPGSAERVHQLLGGQLRPVWDAMWESVDLLRRLPEGERIASRWESDRWSYTAHRDRLRAGEPPQPRRDDAVTAARKLSVRERDQARLQAQEALDDPLVMAERRLAGEAFVAEVTDSWMTYSQGRRPMPRPVLALSTEDTPQWAPGARAYRVLPSGAAQPAEFLAPEDEPADGSADESAGAPGAPGELRLRLTGGMGRAKEPAPGSVPEVGDRVCWTLFEHAPRGGPSLPEPEDTPWTHGGPPQSGTPLPEPRTAERHGTGGQSGEAGRTGGTGPPGVTDPVAHSTLPDPVTAEDLL
ncbi:hypothetical protein [Streptomyces tardus]|uniref:hypothetical protein n=1 Tax=Streptomyces tardus TaxID=2780544 RepID=UPI0027E446A3|nr:hypothetical protein [Streptomyces tardus]